MIKRYDTPPAYPFYWLDEIVEQKLNPSKTNIKSIPAVALQDIKDRLPLEIATIKAALKAQTFSLYTNDELKIIAGHYDLSIRLLKQQALLNLKDYPQRGLLRQLGESLIFFIEELAEGLNQRCPNLIHQNPKDNSAGDLSAIAKVQCALSADQIGVLLKAAYGVKVILGNSFRVICRAIAPSLSTPWRENISWDTIRSNAGRAEKRDKEVAIEFLEKMIVFINDKRR